MFKTLKKSFGNWLDVETKREMKSCLLIVNVDRRCGIFLINKTISMEIEVILFN